MTTPPARLRDCPRGLLFGLLIAACSIAPALTASASAATPIARISKTEQARIARLAAPRVVVDGPKLVWSRVAGVSSYVLARQLVGHASIYQVVSTNSVTLHPVPGATVRYRVKTDIKGSAWARPITVTYNRHGGKSSGAGKSQGSGSSTGSAPSGSGTGTGTTGTGSSSGAGSKSSTGSGSGSGSSAGSGSGSGTGSTTGSGTGPGTGSGSGSGGLGGAPVEEVTAKPATALKVGLIGFAGWGAGPSETIRNATGVKYTRIDPGSEGWAEAEQLVSEGITPLALYNPGLLGMSPAAVAEGVRSYASHMHALGMTEIELGNEVYYHGTTPAEYAAQYRAAHEALVGSGITLIADAWTDAQKPNGEWSQWEAGGGWCVLFVQALGYVPDAWSFHPYGPMSADHFGSGANQQGWGTVPRMMAYMKADHVYAPLDITEVGQPTYQGSDGNTAVTEAEQAIDIRQYLLQAAEWGVASIYLYEAIDTGEGGYGLYSWPLKAKPAAAVFSATLAQLSAA